MCRKCDLSELAESVGFDVSYGGTTNTVIIDGEESSLHIYSDKNTWYRFSSNESGDQIEFLMNLCGMPFSDAVAYILDYIGYEKLGDGSVQIKRNLAKKYLPEEDKTFVLPPKAKDNYHLIQYLHKKRGLSMRVINFFLNLDLIYEADNHAIVFKGLAANGECKFASRRGTWEPKPGEKPYKVDVKNNDKSYGFSVVNDYSKEVVVFEAAIDLMSYMDIYNSYKSNKIALGGTHDAPLETFLLEHPQIDTIRLCLDRDEAGFKAMKAIKAKYEKLGYFIVIYPVKDDEVKDYNEWLLKLKK